MLKIHAGTRNDFHIAVLKIGMCTCVCMYVRGVRKWVPLFGDGTDDGGGSGVCPALEARRRAGARGRAARGAKELPV